jgi:hypothetical protein
MSPSLFSQLDANLIQLFDQARILDPAWLNEYKALCETHKDRHDRIQSALVELEQRTPYADGAASIGPFNSH